MGARPRQLATQTRSPTYLVSRECSRISIKLKNKQSNVKNLNFLTADHGNKHSGHVSWPKSLVMWRCACATFSLWPPPSTSTFSAVNSRRRSHTSPTRPRPTFTTTHNLNHNRNRAILLLLLDCNRPNLSPRPNSIQRHFAAHLLFDQMRSNVNTFASLN